MSQALIRTAYDMWPQYNRRLREVVAAMTDAQLAIRPAPDRWPMWATVGHTAGMRVYWLCDVIGEAGAETAPFTGAANSGGGKLSRKVAAVSSCARRSTWSAL